jgi:hypothetical protein
MFITDKIWKILEPAIKGLGEITREQLEEMLKTGDYKLFTKQESAIITSHQGEILRIGIGGGRLGNIKEITKRIEKYAKKRKYKYIDILGRKGWERALDGYNKKAVLLRKEIT